MRNQLDLGDAGHRAPGANGGRCSRGGGPLPRVLITDGEQRSALAIARSLGRAGYEVHVVSALQGALAGASRHVAASRVVPNPDEEPDAFRDAVLRYIDDAHIDVLVPATDVSMTLLADVTRERSDLVFPAAGLEVYRAISDKHRLSVVAPEVGIAVPRQRVLSISDEGTVEVGAELGFPLVLKPARSAVATAEGMRKAGVQIVTSHADFRRALEGFPPEFFPILAQERIVGPGRGVFVLVWDGHVYAAFAHRRIRERPPTGGASVYRESTAVDRELLEPSRRLLERFGWSGVAMVEFKQDVRTGTLYLMEVNARFWGSLQLAIDAGVDFPRILLSLAEGGRPDPVIGGRVGIRSRWFWGDVDHLLAVVRTPARFRRAMPDLPGVLGAVGRFLIPWRPGDRWEVFRACDPKPFLRESVHWFSFLRRWTRRLLPGRGSSDAERH